MTKNKKYKMSVGTANEYDDYIAEIDFPGKAGLIVSQETGPGKFEVSLHSFHESADESFVYCRNVDEAKISLTDLTEALEIAESELRRLKKD